MTEVVSTDRTISLETDNLLNISGQQDIYAGAIIGDGDRKSRDPRGPMIWDNFSILEQIAPS